LTLCGSVSARDTVAVDTLASRATSASRAALLGRFFIGEKSRRRPAFFVMAACG
jgi:hypothetical protein